VYALVHFFFEEIAAYENLWLNRFQTIYQDPKEAADYQQAGASKLNPFNELITIDNLAKQYSYTHDEVFNLEWEFVYTLKYVHMLQGEVQTKANEIRRNRNKR